MACGGIMPATGGGGAVAGNTGMGEPASMFWKGIGGIIPGSCCISTPGGGAAPYCTNFFPLNCSTLRRHSASWSSDIGTTGSWIMPTKNWACSKACVREGFSLNSGRAIVGAFSTNCWACASRWNNCSGDIDPTISQISRNTTASSTFVPCAWDEPCCSCATRSRMVSRLAVIGWSPVLDGRLTMSSMLSAPPWTCFFAKSLSAESTFRGRPLHSTLSRFRMALNAVSASRYSQNPNPFCTWLSLS
mmetsp:Transcript_29973/g.71963  ORF Transcript_29973/g.71963 Transcript_29973/m.71963 type:complete len:246 (+) Transcript_29973:181-918(+)